MASVALSPRHRRAHPSGMTGQAMSPALRIPRGIGIYVRIVRRDITGDPMSALRNLQAVLEDDSVQYARHAWSTR